MEDYNKIVQDPDFRRLVALLRVAARPHWEREHKDSKFTWLFNRFVKLVGSYTGHASHAAIKADIVTVFAQMLIEATQAQPSLGVYYTESVVAWYVSVLDGDQPHLANMLLLAYSQTEDKMIDCDDAAGIVGLAAGTIKNACASGDVPGAKKVGKTWIVPRAWCELRL